MTHPDGGFYSAEDADSEGHEGKFYCWTRAELAELLTPEEFKVAARYFGITEQGNFMDHSHPQPLPNQNVLSIVDPALTGPEKALAGIGQGEDAGRARRSACARNCDDKVLASWNGLMLGAMARAGAVLGEEAYRAAAEKNLAFLKARLWDAKTKTLWHRWRDGERDNVQLLEGYAFLLAGVIELYEATLEAGAPRLCHRAGRRPCSPGSTTPRTAASGRAPPGAKDLILRVKEDYDGAEPSGNSVAILALLKLGRITDRKDFTPGRREEPAAVRQPAPASSPGRALPAPGARLLARRTPARGGCRRSGQPRDPRPAARHPLRVSAQQSRARQRGSGRALRQDAAGPGRSAWFICAPARPASRRRVTRPKSKNS